MGRKRYHTARILGVVTMELVDGLDFAREHLRAVRA
jgi:hypothetical protein